MKVSTPKSPAKSAAKRPMAAQKRAAQKVEADRLAEEAVTVEANRVAREKARERNPESRARIVRESGGEVPATTGELRIYRLANRLYGTVRVLIDRRGDFSDDADPDAPWAVVEVPADSVYAAADAPATTVPPRGEFPEKSYRTRAALGRGYAKDELTA